MPEPHSHEELIGFLEPDQLTARLDQPVARAELGRGARAALWGLRVLVLMVSAMVVYTFIAELC
jgi:hypothetical protein